MTIVAPVPVARLELGDFIADCRPEDMIYFLLNVGDGDTQLILLPTDESGSRQALVVDVYRSSKLLALIEALGALAPPLLVDRSDLFACVVATHPHEDHIGGIKAFLDVHHDKVEEIWEPGYYIATAGYFELMAAIEDFRIRHLQPTSGCARYIGRVKMTALAPGIGLRSRFDSYGVDPNNASIAVKLEYPMARVVERTKERQYVVLPKPRMLILGADSQTLSWAQVQIDFPQLGPNTSAVAEALRKARGVDPLAAEVLKISHHGSKHGVSLELVELINPKLSLVSSVTEGGSHGFPHQVALEQIREAVDFTTTSGEAHKPDYDLGLHYTGALDDAGAELGSIAVVVSAGGSDGHGGRKLNLWRFGDGRSSNVDLTVARKFV